MALSNLDDNTILFYLNQKAVSPKVKAALQEVVKRKMALQPGHARAGRSWSSRSPRSRRSKPASARTWASWIATPICTSAT